MSGDIVIRFAEPGDTGLLLRLIRELAAYEKAPVAVVATKDDLRRYGFGPDRQFEAILGFLDGEPAGFALFHPRFSTWLGRPGMYLEDLYVTEAARERGVGRRLMIGSQRSRSSAAGAGSTSRCSTGTRRGISITVSAWRISANGCVMAPTWKCCVGSPRKTAINDRERRSRWQALESDDLVAARRRWRLTFVDVGLNYAWGWSAP